MHKKTWLLLGSLLIFPGAARAEPAPLDLEALVKEAIAQHPESQRARRQAEAGAEVPDRVGALPDPRFGVQAQNIRIDQPGLDTSAMSGIQMGLSERVPFPGKLGRRAATATGRATALERDTEVVETAVAFGVRASYWRLHYAELAQAITLESEQVMNALTNAVIARLSVGKAQQQDALQAQVTQSRLRAMLLQRNQAIVSAQRALNSAVGREPEAGLGATRPPQPKAPDREALLKAAREKNPALQASRARVETARRALAEARYERWPDLDFGIGYRVRAEVAGDPSAGADMLGASLGITLPIFLGSKQNARIREQQKALEAAEAARDAVALEITTRLQRLIDAVLRLDEEIRLYEKELIPEADKALDASVSDYQVGGVGFVSVLQNWQTQLDVRLDHAELVTGRAERAAKVRALVEKETSR